MRKDPPSSPQDVQKKIQALKNCIDQSLYSSHPIETHQVKLVPNKLIQITQFVPIPGLTGQFHAHPDTINALREDIFALGEELFDELASKYQCHSCQNVLDLQFWKHCPFCQKLPEM